jgi:hypothetical protein
MHASVHGSAVAIPRTARYIIPELPYFGTGTSKFTPSIFGWNVTKPWIARSIMQTLDVLPSYIGRFKNVDNSIFRVLGPSIRFNLPIEFHLLHGRGHAI